MRLCVLLEIWFGNLFVALVRIVRRCFDLGRGNVRYQIHLSVSFFPLNHVYLKRPKRVELIFGKKIPRSFGIFLYQGKQNILISCIFKISCIILHIIITIIHKGNKLSWFPISLWILKVMVLNEVEYIMP